MLLIDFLQSRDRESVISFTFPIRMIPLMIPSIIPTLPFLASNPSKAQIDEIYSYAFAFLNRRYLL